MNYRSLNSNISSQKQHILPLRTTYQAIQIFTTTNDQSVTTKMQHDLRAAPVDCPTIPVTPPELPALALPHQVIYTNALMDCGAGFSKKEYYMQKGENCFLYVRA